MLKRHITKILYGLFFSVLSQIKRQTGKKEKNKNTRSPMSHSYVTIFLYILSNKAKTVEI